VQNPPHFILEKYDAGESGGNSTPPPCLPIFRLRAATHALMAHGSEAAEGWPI
jgi:hypothetical protein